MDALPTPLNVLIVDDHDIVRLGVRQVLERLPRPCRFRDAASVRDAIDALTQQPADLLMLDLGLGDDFALGALPRCARPAPPRASWC
jgi:two-component system response regulator DevR